MSTVRVGFARQNFDAMGSDIVDAGPLLSSMFLPWEWSIDLHGPTGMHVYTPFMMDDESIVNRIGMPCD